MIPDGSVKTVTVRSGEDIVAVRQAVRAAAIGVSLSLVDQTKIITAASELGRNMLDYGGGGVVTVEPLEEGARKGVRVTFADQGPGIRDIEQAMKDGFTTGNGLGLGLGGSRRLVNHFEIESAEGQGTTIVITRWKL